MDRIMHVLLEDFSSQKIDNGVRCSPVHLRLHVGGNWEEECTLRIGKNLSLGSRYGWFSGLLRPVLPYGN
jgi:hypothetical protein